MDHLTPTLGAIASPHDYRDFYVLAKTVATTPIVLPASFQTTMPGPVLMQDQEPACVAHSVAQILQLYYFRKTGKLINFSPRFLDVLAKRFDGQPIDGGTIPRLVFKLALQYGCATTATVPNDTSLPIAAYRNDSILTQAAFAEALQYKIPGFIKVQTDLTSMREAIFIHGAVSTLMQIGAEWWTPSWNDADIDPLRTPNPSVGGHQIVTKGWTDGQFDELRNSWSAAWANQGESRYNVASWAPYVLEAWTVAEIPADIKDFLNNLPAPSDFHYVWNSNLILGQANDDIKFLQIALMILGFMAPVDPTALGTYGPLTANAVKAYQISKRINPPAPNSVGPQTRAALNAEFAP